MPTIKILDPFTANQIAAGEVVERPASVVKELCENSLDAGASVISVSVRNGGIVAISVVDNGTGMDREDAKTAFLRHATSKLQTISDFDTITTMGFRGEALASIAAVSKITLRTRQIGGSEGSIIRIDDGKIIEQGPTGCPEGTNILVEYLFYNTPARYKFLKKDTTEGSYITDIVERFILARPDVSFRLIQNDQEILHSPGNNDLRSAIFSVYGKSITQALIPISTETDRVRIEGFIGKPEIGRNSRQHQSVFVNNRYVKSKIITAAIDEGYKTLLMKGKFAFSVLNLALSPALVDVNVHPQKTEVKFWNDQEIFRSVLHALKEALSIGITIQEIAPEQDFAAGSKGGSDNGSINVSEYGSKEGTDNGSKGGPFGSASGAKTTPYQYPIGHDYKEQKQTMIFQEEPFNAAGNRPDPRYEPAAAIPITEQIDHDNIYNNANPDAISVNELAKARYIGVLFHTYLLLELEDNLILIDQHAAHERILFETLVERHKNRIPIAQMLLTPEIIELPAHEISIVKENLEFLYQTGFECEIFGTQSVILRTVPLEKNEIDIRNAFRSVLDVLHTPDQSREDRISNAFYSIACKAAVKAHDVLDDLEIAHLLETLRHIPHPTHCPHGRPILLKMSRHEIEKDFKRIVT